MSSSALRQDENADHRGDRYLLIEFDQRNLALHGGGVQGGGVQAAAGSSLIGLILQ
jgi:hypothetical protein